MTVSPTSNVFSFWYTKLTSLEPLVSTNIADAPEFLPTILSPFRAFSKLEFKFVNSSVGSCGSEVVDDSNTART